MELKTANDILRKVLNYISPIPSFPKEKRSLITTVRLFREYERSQFNDQVIFFLLFCFDGRRANQTQVRMLFLGCPCYFRVLRETCLDYRRLLNSERERERGKKSVRRFKHKSMKTLNDIWV